MDSTELMRELNSSIDMLMDSENYLLALNESMNQVQCVISDRNPPKDDDLTQKSLSGTSSRKHS
jgi:hypothetical protein